MPKRKFMVMKRTKRPVVIDTGRGLRKTWRENGGKADFFYVSNEAEAKEIDEVYGTKGTQDVWVREHGQAGHDATYKEDHVHNYFFGSSKVYSDAWQKIFGRRRNGKAEKSKKDQKASRLQGSPA
jgi:hypothetical protein